MKPSLSVYGEIVGAARVCCLYHDAESGGWVASPGLCEALGLPAEWLLCGELPFAGRVHQEEAARFSCDLRNLSVGSPVQDGGIVRLRHANGNWNWFRYRMSCNGVSLIIFSDITEERQMEAAVLDSQMRLSGVYNAAPVAIILWSREGRVTDWNRNAETMFGYAPEQVLYQKLVPLLIAPEEYENFSGNVVTMLKSDQACRLVCRTLTSSGESLFCEWRNVSLRSPKGGLVGILSLVLDVTAQMEAEASMRKARDTAETLSRAKGEFIALISHELRTPLNGILGMAQLLEHSPLGEDEQMFVREILHSGWNLQKVADAIMEYAEVDKIEADRGLESVSLLELVHVLHELYALNAQRKGLEFVLQLSDEDAARQVWLNSRKLERMFAILLDNAVKYTDVGTVMFKVFYHSLAKGKAELRFEVEDTGIGMSPEFVQNSLFIPFRQAEDHRVRKHEGLGLGLALVKKTIEAIGGHIEVSSVPGEGTRFTILLTVAEA